MDTKIDDPQLAAAARDLSLIRGGPFYRAQEAARLFRPDEWLAVILAVVSLAIVLQALRMVLR